MVMRLSAFLFRSHCTDQKYLLQIHEYSAKKNLHHKHFTIISARFVCLQKKTITLLISPDRSLNALNHTSNFLASSNPMLDSINEAEDDDSKGERKLFFCLKSSRQLLQLRKKDFFKSDSYFQFCAEIERFKLL